MDRMRQSSRVGLEFFFTVGVSLGMLSGAWNASLLGQTAGATDPVYRVPPPELARVVDAPVTPSVSLSPDQQTLLVIEWYGLPGIDELSQEELRIAGLRINPRNSGPSRARYSKGLKLQTVAGGIEKAVEGFPANPRITSPSWAPDSRRIACLVTFRDRIELWTVDVASARASRLIENAVNDCYSNGFEWSSDGRGILATVVPEGRGTPPEKPSVPTGPVIQENLGRKAPAWTYQDLLASKYDESLFEYFADSQLVRASLNGSVGRLGKITLISRFSPSPDGKYILVETTERPFSYTVPADRFPGRIEVWSASGELVRTVAELPLADNVPVTFGSVPTGPRSVDWRADADATLVWVEALDGGDAGREAALRDQLYALDAPFRSAPRKLFPLDQRFSRIDWGSEELALVTGGWWQTRQEKVWRFRPGSPEKSPDVVMEYSSEDRYHDPGSPVTRRTERGTRVLVTSEDGRSIYLAGKGAGPEGDRPFLDRFEPESRKAERLFQSEKPWYEEPVALIGAGEGQLLVSRESVDVQPNYWLRNLNNGALTQVTAFPHPNPEFSGVRKELVRYKRADGVDLTGTLYLPAGYETGRDGPLPLLMWAYPQEFKSAGAAGQVTDSPYRFIRVNYWSPMIWLARGYAVLDDPSMPIVGEGKQEPNDTFIRQLVASAEAAVNEVVRRGVARKDQIVIGGHSYGAFMTANLLAHSDLFRAGIARSGAYNRTLTPFGFQSEERTIWQAPEVYYAMSPFLHADLINEPILLIHGQADNNSGTFPLQSERMFSALKGLGATVRLVLLPSESHGYQARESIMHMLWEMSEWMDRYAKNAGPRGVADSH